MLSHVRQGLIDIYKSSITCNLMNIQRIARLLERGDDDLIIRSVILDYAQKHNQILYGSQSFNLQSPYFLRKKTSDYDLLSTKPKKSAKEVAKILRRRLNKKIIVKKATHKGTWKVLINDVPKIDYTQKARKPKTKKNWGIEVRNLKSIKRNTQRLIKNPKTEFRRKKDLDTLQRLKEIERIEREFKI